MFRIVVIDIYMVANISQQS